MKNAGEVAHAPAPAGPGVPTAQFFIPAATSLQEARTPSEFVWMTTRRSTYQDTNRG